MKFLNIAKNIQFPNMVSIFKSSKNTKNKLAYMDMNKINVHFYYADNRFKTTIEGTIKHESEIPIVYIDYPEKLAFLIPEESLVYDVKNESFEISVNEKYTHSVEFYNNITNEMITDVILPILPKKLNYKIVEVEGIKNKTDDKNIVLTSKMLSSLGRAKILERTIEQNNDGLMIMALIGALIGFCIGLIINFNQ